GAVGGRGGADVGGGLVVEGGVEVGIDGAAAVVGGEHHGAAVRRHQADLQVAGERVADLDLDVDVGEGRGQAGDVHLRGGGAADDLVGRQRRRGHRVPERQGDVVARERRGVEGAVELHREPGELAGAVAGEGVVVRDAVGREVPDDRAHVALEDARAGGDGDE